MSPTPEPSKTIASSLDIRNNALDRLTKILSCIHTLLDLYIAYCRDNRDILHADESQLLPELNRNIEEWTTLHKLCQIFGLSLFECIILLTCVGQAIDRKFPDLLAIAHDDPQLNYLTFQLALECFPQPHWDALTDTRPLRQWYLIHCASTPELPRARLQIDEAILHYLMGEFYRDPAIAKIVIPMPTSGTAPTPLQPSYQAIVTQATSLLQGNLASPPVIELCGTQREFQRDIIKQVAQHLQLSLYYLPSYTIPKNLTDLQGFVMRWQRWYLLAPSVLILEVDRQATTDSSSHMLLETFLRSLQTPVFVTTNERLQLSLPALITFDVGDLEYGEQLALWQTAWQNDDRAGRETLPQLAAQFRLSAAIVQTASAAVQSDSSLSATEIGDRLWEFCRLQTRPQLEGLAQRIEVKTTWEDLVLPEREKNTLQQLLIHVSQQAKVYQNWGFAGKNQRGLGLSVLFAGSSGTGKTTAAEVLANELKLDLFRIDLSAVISKYIGETEKNLSRIFDAAERGGAILLFDEADALFGSRTEVKDSHDRHANIEVSYLLQRMEAYQGLAILTTNFKDNLDRAFMRRLRFIINFPYPKAAERSQIWQRVFPQKTPTEGLNFQRLGQLDVTGGNIKSIALNAAFLAADAEEPVKMKHILEAARTEYMKWGQSLGSAEIRGWDLS
ncbi:ATP-binding protein [Roseofilum casamattae]|uniref:AAA family ATPase n=1 Tax=Roseofilum casamattae BLCC-M143 TaxID=3022442 RepID=A0ABT7BYM6_9CYAN|nr:AAA family ATPase [Roseofilum casamattae]MDJ1183604.1 AAA family ATPase [Roseofilum casamattae BLCC-M143]